MKKLSTQTFLRHGQHGAALIIGLIFLVLLTLIGVTAMQSTTLQEKMAGNMRERDRAFQGAESALRIAEISVMGQSPWAFTVSCASGLCAQGSAPDWSSYAWDGSKDVTISATIAGLASAPRYFAEYAGEVKRPGSSGGWVSAYRITTRSTGGNANTVVHLQETYRQ